MLSILVPSVHFLNFFSWAFILFSYDVGLNTPSLAVCYCQIQYKHHNLLNDCFKRISINCYKQFTRTNYRTYLCFVIFFMKFEKKVHISKWPLWSRCISTSEFKKHCWYSNSSWQHLCYLINISNSYTIA